jgi:hypothetical protein
MDKKRKRKRKKNTLTCRTGSDELEEVVVVPASQRDAVCDQALAGGGQGRSEARRSAYQNLAGNGGPNSQALHFASAFAFFALVIRDRSVSSEQHPVELVRRRRRRAARRRRGVHGGRRGRRRRRRQRRQQVEHLPPRLLLLLVLLGRRLLLLLLILLGRRLLLLLPGLRRPAGDLLAGFAGDGGALGRHRVQRLHVLLHAFHLQRRQPDPIDRLAAPRRAIRLRVLAVWISRQCALTCTRLWALTSPSATTASSLSSSFISSSVSCATPFSGTAPPFRTDASSAATCHTSTRSTPPHPPGSLRRGSEKDADLGTAGCVSQCVLLVSTVLPWGRACRPRR